MIAQDALFDVAPSDIPPTKPPVPATVEPCHPCAKVGCTEPATLKSPSGAMYCKEHGKCKRVEVVMKNGKVVRDMSGNVVTKSVCSISAESFVWWERHKMYVCPCVVRFAVEQERMRDEKQVSAN